MNIQHPMPEALLHTGMSAVRVPRVEANVLPLPRQMGGGKPQVRSTKLKRSSKHPLPMTRGGRSDWSLGFGHSLELWPLNFELRFVFLRDTARDALKNGAGTASSPCFVSSTAFCEDEPSPPLIEDEKDLVLEPWVLDILWSIGCISLFRRSRSDYVMVAVGLSPRNDGWEMLRVAERRLNRRANRSLQASLRDARFLCSFPVRLSPRLPSSPRSARQTRQSLAPEE